MTMIVRTIYIAREGAFSFSPSDQSKPFRATISLDADNGKIELLLSPEVSAKVVDLIADEIVAAGRATAEAMTAEVLTVKALPAAEPALGGEHF
jgi:hypothetical protein